MKKIIAKLAIGATLLAGGMALTAVPASAAVHVGIGIGLPGVYGGGYYGRPAYRGCDPYYYDCGYGAYYPSYYGGYYGRPYYGGGISFGYRGGYGGGYRGGYHGGGGGYHGGGHSGGHGGGGHHR